MKNKLTRLDLFSMATGQIIGVGIMTMTGIAIGFTGRSANIAYIIAGIITLFSIFPQVFIGGTANFLGGQYSQIATLSGKKMAGIYIYIQAVSAIAISLFAISFSQYFASIVPGVSQVLVGCVILTLICAMNLFGVKQAARLQTLLLVVLTVAITLYITFGINDISTDYFKEDFVTGGVSGFVLASFFLTFATGGAAHIVNFSSDAKNPTKDIPFVIIGSTIFVVVLYAIMATIAAGVLPVSEVANQPLSVSAISFMPKSVFNFFVIGGAMFALLTTLNFSVGMLVNPIAKGCEDGWLPKGLAKANEKWGTHHFIILVIYIIGMIPIIFNLEIKTVANSTIILFSVIKIVIAISAMKLPTVMTDLWNKSDFHISNKKLFTVSIVSIIFSSVCVLVLLVSSPMNEIIANIVVLVIAAILTTIMSKKTEIKVNYTEK